MNRDFEGFVSEYTDEVGQDASKHTVYKVHIKMKENPSIEYTLWRRYSDFLKLWEHIRSGKYPEFANFKFPSKALLSSNSDNTKIKRMECFDRMIKLCFSVNPLSIGLESFLELNDAPEELRTSIISKSGLSGRENEPINHTKVLSRMASNTVVTVKTIAAEIGGKIQPRLPLMGSKTRTTPTTKSLNEESTSETNQAGLFSLRAAGPIRKSSNSSSNSINNNNTETPDSIREENTKYIDLNSMNSNDNLNDNNSTVRRVSNLNNINDNNEGIHGRNPSMVDSNAINNSNSSSNSMQMPVIPPEGPLTIKSFVATSQSEEESDVRAFNLGVEGLAGFSKGSTSDNGASLADWIISNPYVNREQVARYLGEAQHDHILKRLASQIATNRALDFIGALKLFARVTGAYTVPFDSEVMSTLIVAFAQSYCDEASVPVCRLWHEVADLILCCLELFESNTYENDTYVFESFVQKVRSSTAPGSNALSVYPTDILLTCYKRIKDEVTIDSKEMLLNCPSRLFTLIYLEDMVSWAYNSRDISRRYRTILTKDALYCFEGDNLPCCALPLISLRVESEDDLLPSTLNLMNINLDSGVHMLELDQYDKVSNTLTVSHVLLRFVNYTIYEKWIDTLSKLCWEVSQGREQHEEPTLSAALHKQHLYLEIDM